MNRPRRRALSLVLCPMAVLAAVWGCSRSTAENLPDPRDLQKRGVEIAARAQALSARVDGDSLQLYAPVFPDSGGNRYLTIGTDHGPAALIFSTPYRAYRYMRFQPDSLPPYGILALRAPRCVEVLRAMETPFYVLDRSPQCEKFTAHPSDSATVEILKLAWAINRITGETVFDRHYPTAFEHALEGRYADALGIVADLLNCVSPDDLRVHCLLGACGLGLEREALVVEAVDGLNHIVPEMAAWLSEVAADVAQGRVARRQGVERILAVIQEGERQAAARDSVR